MKKQHTAQTTLHFCLIKQFDKMIRSPTLRHAAVCLCLPPLIPAHCPSHAQLSGGPLQDRAENSALSCYCSESGLTRANSFREYRRVKGKLHPKIKNIFHSLTCIAVFPSRLFQCDLPVFGAICHRDVYLLLNIMDGQMACGAQSTKINK